MNAAAGPVLLSAVGLEKRYARRAWLGGGAPAAPVTALAGVDLDVRRGECLGIVGESGSGKTTLALCLLRLVEPTAGRLRFDGRDLLALSPRQLRRERRHFQMIYQDPFDSLDPRQSIGSAVAEPLRLRGDAAPRATAERLLATVGLPPHLGGRLPHQLSGGQRQRVGIARALAMEPQLLIADEPVSALDVSVRSQILNLLAELQRRMGLTVVLIAHDLSVVEQMADRVAVFYCGRIVEMGRAADLFASPLHPYTASLIAAAPAPLPPALPPDAAVPAGPGGAAAGAAGRRIRPPITGEPPSALAPPPGCPFHPRCPAVQERCRRELPPLVAGTSPAGERQGRSVACFFPLPPGTRVHPPWPH